MTGNYQDFRQREITREWMNPGSHVSPLRFLARRFPQTAPIVVSRIFGVTGLSEYTPTPDNLQNKQLRQWRGSVSVVASPTLKLESPILFKIRSLFGFENPYLISRHDLLLSERKGIHFSWKVNNSLPNRKGNVAHISHVETGSSFSMGYRRGKVACISHMEIGSSF